MKINKGWEECLWWHKLLGCLSSFEQAKLYFVPITMPPLSQRLLVAKSLFLSAGSKAKYRPTKQQEQGWTRPATQRAEALQETHQPKQVRCRSCQPFNNFPEGMKPRECYFAQLRGVRTSPPSPAVLNCTWQLWTQEEEGHQVPPKE